MRSMFHLVPLAITQSPDGYLHAISGHGTVVARALFSSTPTVFTAIAEMKDGDVYEAVETYSRQQKLAYVHLRNVRDKVPYYKETFIDDGEVDVLRVLKILQKNNFDGVVIPDHAPQMTCAAPWHAGMAYAMGWMRASMNLIEKGA